MESKIIITKEIIEKASDYMPLQLKVEMVERIAQECVARVVMTKVGKNGEQEPLPDRCQEQQLLTNLYLMGVLASNYLFIPYEGEYDAREDNPYYGLMMPLDIYDRFAASHVVNQLEKLKGDKDCRDKVFNILYDYGQFRRMLYDEIHRIVEHRNDVVWRLTEALEADVKTAISNEVLSRVGDDEKTDADAIREAEGKLRKYLANKERADALAEQLTRRLQAIKEASQKNEAVADE
jgi:hypothetical protein